MKRLLIIAVIGVLLLVGAAYRVHRAAVPPASTSQPAIGGKSTVTPDPRFADFFEALDRQWNAENKQRVLDVSPTGDTRKAPSPNATNKKKE